MRLARAGIAVAVVLLAVSPVPAAATPVSGNITRVGDNVIRISVTNTGSTEDVGLRIDLPTGIGAVVVNRISGPAASCSPNPDTPNRIDCFFDPPGMSPGATLVIEVLTSPRMPDKAGAQAYSCGIPCNVNNMSGPYALNGPPSASESADLGVEIAVVKEPGEQYQWSDSDRQFWDLRFRLVVTNHGPASASNVSIEAIPDAVPDGSRSSPMEGGLAVRRPGEVELVTGADCERSEAEPSRGMCKLAELPAGLYGDTFWTVSFPELGTVSLKLEASSDTPDLGPHPNSSTFTDTLVELPFSRGGEVTRSSRIDLINGDAKDAVRVHAAVARESGGAKVGPPAGRRGSASAAPACHWLTSKRVRFRRERGRRCDEPTYLTAKVRRGQWKIRLRKKLPPGRYVLITRAQSRDGVVESAVGPRLGNLKRFRVKRR